MLFDEKYYLEANPDVRGAIANGLFMSGHHHYNGFGVKEARVAHRIAPLMKPSIVLYTITHNEEFMMPFFLEHYFKFVDKIIVYDNDSTDKTTAIVSAYPNTEVRKYHTDGMVNDMEMRRIKSTCYQEQRGKADYVIVCDADEFLYAHSLHEMIVKLALFKATGITVVNTYGYEMMSETLPVHGIDLTRQVQRGLHRPIYNKNVLFNPEIDINYSPGCHDSLSSGNIVASDIKFILLHYKFLSLSYILDKARGRRFCPENYERGFGQNTTQEFLIKDFKELTLNSRRVIDGWQEEKV